MSKPIDIQEPQPRVSSARHRMFEGMRGRAQRETTVQASDYADAIARFARAVIPDECGRRVLVHLHEKGAVVEVVEADGSPVAHITCDAEVRWSDGMFAEQARRIERGESRRRKDQEDTEDDPESE